MQQDQLPEWESEVIDDAIRTAERRLERERGRARRRALQLAREQGYHRLAVAIERSSPADSCDGQLSLFGDAPTLFDACD